MLGNRRIVRNGWMLAAGALLALAAPSLRAGVIELVHRDGFEDEPFTAFRVTDIDLRDPHAFADIIGCRDLTDTALGGFSFNAELESSIQNDVDGDGFLDRSDVLVFRPLQQGNGGGVVQAVYATCTAPSATTTCARDGSAVPGFLTTYGSAPAGVTCLAPLAGTTRPYVPAIVSSTGPCFLGGEATLIFNLAGIPLALIGVEVAATFVGAPASTLSNGLLRGFLTEPVANATTIPANYPLVGGQPLSRLFPGGTGNCAAHSDKDMRDGVAGWWIYFNFTAAPVPYTE